LNKTIWANYTKAHPGVRVAYTEYNPPDEGKALQLAYQSKQAPDVHTLAGVSLPVSQLLKDNWFAPIDPYVDQAWKSRFPAGSLLEGLSVFGGKVYSFPIFSFRQHTTLNWYNKQLLSDAGIDPATGLKTWDDFRKTAAAITKKGNGKVYGLDCRSELRGPPRRPRHGPRPVCRSCRSDRLENRAVCLYQRSLCSGD